MASTKVKAVVINGLDLKEKDKLITLYTLEEGKKSVSMRGVRGEKAKLKSGKELFCFGEYVLEQTKAGSLVIQVDIIDNFFNLTKDINKYFEACAVLDIVNKISSAQADAVLFIELIKCLKTLCYEEVKSFYCIDKFLISVFKALGYSFITEKCSSCKTELNSMRYFNLEVGEMVCPLCKNSTSIIVNNSCYMALKLFDNLPYEKLSTLKLGGEAQKECFSLLEKNFEWRFGYKINNLLVQKR